MVVIYYSNLGNSSIDKSGELILYCHSVIKLERRVMCRMTMERSLRTRGRVELWDGVSDRYNFFFIAFCDGYSHRWLQSSVHDGMCLLSWAALLDKLIFLSLQSTDVASSLPFSYCSAC